ncbi:hypothetical protein SAMN04489761_0127 [Tenacibaculum sp. MAR_2009_124]|nr:hypothetical protein [Tenacibaculum sp. MAR_2009_124]SEB36146.1 hypothetical protein SAMN04489761_0127 [Tenacibaculum sp. MAR_2009_124]
MLKNIYNLGKPLNKTEQKVISGGKTCPWACEEDGRCSPCEEKG